MALEWRGQQVSADVEANITAAIFNGAEHIRQVSHDLTPIETGDLRQNMTAQAEGAEGVVFNPLVYAARQHEETGWNHPRGGQAKFLKAAVDSEGPKVAQMMANQIRKALGG